MDAIQTSPLQVDFSLLKAALETYPSHKAIEAMAPSGWFSTILTPLCREKAGCNWRAVRYLWDIYEQGLKYARQGKLSSAEQVFIEAYTARLPFVTNQVLDRLIDVEALPAVAYLYYKQERYAEAESLLIHSLNSDAELLTDGIYILEYHRVQQLHNLARLYFRQGRLEEGARLIGMALNYLLFHQVPTVGNGKGWSNEQTHAIPNELRSDMLWQLTSETAGVLLIHPTELDTLSQLAFSNMTSWTAQTLDEIQILAWFTLIESKHRDYWPINMQGLVTFLTTSSLSFDPLKMVLILQIVAASDQSSLIASGLQESIEYFMSQLQLGQSQRESCSLFINSAPINSFAESSS